MGHEFFLNKPAVKVQTNYVLVGGTFQCRFCGSAEAEARYYPEHSLLSWDCEVCKSVNNVEGFNLD